MAYVQLTRDGGRDVDERDAAGRGRGARQRDRGVAARSRARRTSAITRYKFNDFTPHVFKTTDFGKTWTRIVEGIAPEAWARVVREDPVRKDLLYLGTELGLLRVVRRRHALDAVPGQPARSTPITDLKVHQGDLLASTAGRAFWILDDLSPLRQWDASAPADGARALRAADGLPHEQLRWRGGRARAAIPRRARSSTTGSRESPKDPITLDVLDATGAVDPHLLEPPRRGRARRRPDGRAAAADEGRPESVVWDLRRECDASRARPLHVRIAAGPPRAAGHLHRAAHREREGADAAAHVAMDPRVETRRGDAAGPGPTRGECRCGTRGDSRGA